MTSAGKDDEAMDRMAVAKELVALAKELTAGAGVSPDRLYRMIRNGLLKMARGIESRYPDSSLRYHDGEVSGTVAGHDVRFFYEVLRASNAEVAGLPVLEVDGKQYSRFQRNVADKLAEVIGG